MGAELTKYGEKKNTNYGDIFVNLEGDIENNDDQIVTHEKPENIHISLQKILNSKFSEIKKEYSDEYIDKIQEYKETFSGYRFSTIVLLKEDIDSAIEVFTRINTGGQTLTLFEIMSAKTYDEEQKFDMEDRFQKLMKELTEYNSISSSIILNIISLILSKNKECKRKTKLQLEKQKIIDVWDDVISALKESIDYFRSVYRIPVSAILPYDSLLVPFAYFFYVQKGNPRGMQIKYLEEFFWRASLSERYSSAAESKLAQDIRRIDEILKGNRPNYDDFKVNLNLPIDLIKVGFSAGNSYCKAILCLLAYHEPKDFRDNGRVLLDNSWLKVANSKNYHHFFPKAYLRKNKIENENSLVNISFVKDTLNKKKIGAKAPSIYIQEFLDENDELPTTLKSHLINDIDDFGITSDDYSVFLEKRANIILNELKDRINLRHREEKTDTKIHEMILGGENDKLELKSTLRYSLREGNINKNLEYVVAKTISAFLNTDGGTLIIGVDDDGNILGLEKDMQTLSKNNLDGFELHLRQTIKKYLGDSFEKYLVITFPEIDDKHVCMIKIAKSGKPVFVKLENDEKFFVRIGNSSIPKTRQEQSEYEKLHWN